MIRGLMYIPKFPETELVQNPSMKRQVGRMIVLKHISRDLVGALKQVRRGRLHTYKSDPMSMLGYHMKSHKIRLHNVP